MQQQSQSFDEFPTIALKYDEAVSICKSAELGNRRLTHTKSTPMVETVRKKTSGNKENFISSSTKRHTTRLNDKASLYSKYFTSLKFILKLKWI